VLPHPEKTLKSRTAGMALYEPFPLMDFPRENQSTKNQFTPKAAKI